MLAYRRVIPKILIDGGYVTLLGGAVPVVIGNITIVIGIGAPYSNLWRLESIITMV